MAMPPITWSTRKIIFGTILLAAIAAFLVFLIRYAQVVFIIVLALTLSVAIEPFTAWLQRHNFRRQTSAMLAYGALLLGIALVLVMIVPLIFSQVSTISTLLPEYYTALRDFLLASPAGLVRAVGAQLPPTLQDLLASMVIGSDSPIYLVNQAAGVLFDTLLVFLLAFYWTLDRERAIRFFIIRLPELQRDQVREAIATFEEKVGAYIRGQALLCVIVGAMAFIAYLAIGLPYAFSLAIAAGVFEAIPMIGPAIGAVPALLLAMAIAPEDVFWVIIASLIIQQVENNLLVPKIMDRSVGVNPVVSVLAIAAFSLLFGLPGALLAIPAAAVVQVALDRFIFSNPALLSTAENNPSITQVTLPASNGIKTVVTKTAPSNAADAPAVLPVTGQPAQGGTLPAAGLTDEAGNPNAALSEMLIPAARDHISVLHLEIHELTQDIRKQQRQKGVLTDPVSDEIEDSLEAIAESLNEIIARHTNLQTGAE